MSDKLQKVGRIAATVATVLTAGGILVGVLVTVWRSSALTNTVSIQGVCLERVTRIVELQQTEIAKTTQLVAQINSRLEKVEHDGSNGLTAHVSKDDQRFEDLRSRVLSDEETIRKIMLELPRIAETLARVETSLQFLTGQRKMPPQMDMGTRPSAGGYVW